MTPLRHCRRCRIRVSSGAMLVKCRILRLVVVVLMLLGTGAWGGHAAGYSPPSHIMAVYKVMPPPHVADHSTPLAAECAVPDCAGAAVIADRPDSNLHRRRIVSVLRYTVIQRAGPPGIDPQPMPFPPRQVMPID